MTKFSELTIVPALAKEIAARGFVEATPVQEAVLAAGDGDLVVSSQTGSGKTLAFGVALAPMLYAGKPVLPNKKHPRAVVVAPTRELALQVARELTWLFKSSGAKIVTCVGGMDVRREERWLRMGCDVVVATPGRACDHIDRGNLNLADLKTLVLDEADEMLDMGFRDELEKILEAAPPQRRTLLFSATFPKGIEALTRKYTKDPKRISATANSAAHADIEYIVHEISPRDRDKIVVNVLRYYEATSALVFCATRIAVAELCSRLTERGFLAVALSGELSQAERNRALSAVREDRARILVATDVAARGIDLPNVSLVVHADLPQDVAVLQHRSGRTGRAGKKGTAVVLVPHMRRRGVERGMQEAKITSKVMPVPTAAQIRSLDDQRVVHDIAERIAALDDDEAGTLTDVLPATLMEQFTPLQLARVVIADMRKLRPAPEEFLTQKKDDRRPQREEYARADRRPSREGDSGGRDAPRRGPPDRQAPERGPPPRAAAPDTRDDGPPDEFDTPIASSDGGVWFSVNVGSEQRADPKWLLPMLCRRGQITKADLGTFEVRRRETRFEINPKAAQRFAASAARPDRKDPHIKIDRV